MILLDTDHLSVLTDRRAAGHAALVRHRDHAGEPLAIPIMAVEEQCKGARPVLGLLGIAPGSSLSPGFTTPVVFTPRNPAPGARGCP
ncbi:MAG: hypothetical protein J2P46_21015 [Zavarzinella sp.]|nr:hypothetical protein [Zavarzinella sp.]